MLPMMGVTFLASRRSIVGMRGGKAAADLELGYVVNL
jgi:hypothetical protein